jgi:hypothetical protein
MGKYISARAAVAGLAAITLAGCGSAASTSGAASGGSPAASASGTAGTASASATTSADATASPAGAAGASAPFPVALGNTWVYEAVTSINNAHSTDTKKVLSVTPVTGGRRVTMSDTVIPGPAKVTQNYVFYDNGQIGFPISQSHGISVISGNGIVWPDAADLASGQAFHSTSQVKLASGQFETADITVSGGGTQPVSVPAGTYQATLVNMVIVTHVGSFTTTITVKEWTAPGTGPVKSQEIIKAAGQSQVTTTEALLSFTKG